MKKNTIYIIATIAAYSIISYFMNSLGFTTKWWSLPVIAVGTGFLSLLFSKLSSRFRIGNSLLAVGMNLILLMTFLPLLDKYRFWVLLSSFIIVAMPLGFVTNKTFHPGDIVFVPALGALSAFSIQGLNLPVITPAILFISYVLVIFITIACKERKEKSLNNKEEDTTPPSNNKIDIDIE